MVSVVSLTTPLNLATGGVESVNFTVNDNGAKSFSIPSDSPNFAASLGAIESFKAGDLDNDALGEKLLELVNLVGKVAKKFVRVNDIMNGRMTLSGSTILVDYEPIDSALESYILRLLREDGTPKDVQNWRSFSRFVEKLYSNTSEHVRAQLFGWLQYENTHGQGFTIAEDGDLIGYKGCAGTVDMPTSRSHGTAIVNGVQHQGAIPNPIGAVVEMPRSAVQDDPRVGCSTGLHVGTYGYAKSFSAGILLKVKFSPADVVSVPTECQAQKVRSCRYTVLEVTQKADTRAVYSAATLDCENCGDPLKANEDTYCVECVEELKGAGDNASVQDSTDRETLFKQAESTGKEVTFLYNGKLRSGVVTSTWTDWDRVLRVNVKFEDGSVRTFKNNKVRQLKVASGAVAPAVTPVAPVAAKPAHVSLLETVHEDGGKVWFGYLGKNRIVSVEDVYEDNNVWYMRGTDQNDTHFKTFKVAEMTNTRVYV